MHPYGLRWRNFRSFRDTGWIKLRPITVLIGPNDSGKTSVHLPLLVGKQTIASRDDDLALKTRGDLVNVGGFVDFVRNHDVTNRVAMSIRWHDPTEENDAPVFEIPPAEVAVEFINGTSPGYESVLRSYRVSDRAGRDMVTRSRVGDDRYRLYGPLSDAIYKDPLSEPPSEVEARQAIRDHQPTKFLFDMQPVFHAAMNAHTPRRSSRKRQGESGAFRSTDLKLSGFVTDYMRTIDWVEHHVHDLFKSLLYVGPLRASPERVYEVSPEVPPDCGVAGENAPELLFRNPELLEGVGVWLERFGVQGKLRVRQLLDSAFALELERPAGGLNANLADVGFGISQALPIIVQVMAAERDSIVVAEQPEIHLNPRLQAKLADLFVEAASRDVASIIETHSEYLLLRLRTLVAEGVIDAADVAVYFVERGSGGESTLTLLPMQQDGHIEPEAWPSGFFEDSLREAMALAVAQSARTR